MKIRDAIEQYIAWRQAHGTQFKSGSVLLHCFLKGIDTETGCDAVTEAQVRAFLRGKGILTRYRANQYAALAGFYRYAISRGYASCSPLPDNEPKKPPVAPPYIYTHDEVRRLFDAIDVERSRAIQLDAPTFRMLLLLLYGAGLRRTEAWQLTLADVDLSGAVLTVNNSKFYRSRLVPVGAQLAAAIEAYAALRSRHPLPQGSASSFLANRDGTPLAKRTVNGAFVGLLRVAGIDSSGSQRQSPRLHSLRHTFATNRLTAWYRQGADVQRLLPVLSTYPGHKDLTGTQVYLSMTPQLLQQASLRFERYARGGNNE